MSQPKIFQNMYYTSIKNPLFPLYTPCIYWIFLKKRIAAVVTKNQDRSLQNNNIFSSRTFNHSNLIYITNTSYLFRMLTTIVIKFFPFTKKHSPARIVLDLITIYFDYVSSSNAMLASLIFHFFLQ